MGADGRKSQWQRQKKHDCKFKKQNEINHQNVIKWSVFSGWCHFCFGNFNPQAPPAETPHSLQRAQRSSREPAVDPGAAYLHRDLSICSSLLAGQMLVLTCRLARRTNASSAAFKIPLYSFIFFQIVSPFCILLHL